jgi:hypothetical protein
MGVGNLAIKEETPRALPEPKMSGTVPLMGSRS